MSPPPRPDPDAAHPPRPSHDYLAEPPSARRRSAAGRPAARGNEYYRGRPTRPAAGQPGAAGAARVRRNRLADRRGLTVAGAVTLAAVFIAFGTVVDAELAAPSDATLRTLFTACYAAGGLLAALLVHRERVGSVVVALPLLYALATALGGAIYAERNSESLLKQGGLDAVTSLVTHAPTLLVVTGLAALLGLLRRRAARRSSPGGPRGRSRAGARRPS